MSRTNKIIKTHFAFANAQDVGPDLPYHDFKKSFLFTAPRYGNNRKTFANLKRVKRRIERRKGSGIGEYFE